MINFPIFEEIRPIKDKGNTEATTIETTELSTVFSGADLSDDEEVDQVQGEWRPTKQTYTIIGTLSMVCLLCALDATALVGALPVSHAKSRSRIS